MRVLWISCVALAACGGKPKSSTIVEDTYKPDPALEKAEAEREQLMAERPKSPYEVRAVHGFAAPSACGQGPYRIPASALGAKYGERVQIMICAAHPIEGDYRRIGKDASEARHFGFWGDGNDRCTATATELAEHGSASAGTPGTAKGKHRGKAHAAAVTTKTKTVELEAIAVEGDECPKGMFSTSIEDYTYESSDARAMESGASLAVELWSGVPLDLENAIFLVRQTAPREGITADEWRDYQRRYREWSERYNAFSQREVDSGRSHWISSKPHSEAPPPARAETRPPRPSDHASWIPGYWHRDKGASEWAWIAGFWRVPKEDIVAERTTHAPVAPPRARTESAPPRPAATAVWTPGYWSWNGTAYIWIVGAWRIPPPRARWIAPRWRPARRSGAVIFVPGGWSIRLR